MQPAKELDDSDTEDHLSNFPINTQADYDEMKIKLDDKDYYKSVVKSITGLGKLRTLSMTVKSIMNALINLTTGTIFTFQGRGGKKIAFQGSVFHRLVVQASRKLYKNETQANIDSWIEDWLVHCNDKIKRLKKKEEKRLEKEAAQNFSFSDLDGENSE
ncbi:uncharacterized protein LOC122501827 [Leptopilina heterotoma]|uniref:uncharacterized protein LOC122501827 n=1 Tax=Leptopilina heterotoma TaxID=63436 RepID=UPI001CA7E154|nr:uncharacterized protein LOC122501827 [Leptopilina heterotoma]